MTLSKTLNYRIASEMIHISTPSLHKQIKNLESYLQVKLFYTEHQKLQLTKEGMTFVPLAQKVINTHEESLNQLHLCKKHQKFQIKVVVSSYIAYYILPNFFKLFFNNYPDINISIHVQNNHIEDDIKNDLFDVGISRQPPQFKNVISHNICEGKIYLFAPNTTENQLLSESELLNKYKILCDNHPVYWKLLKRQIHDAYCDARFTSISSVPITEKLISMDQGISYLPKYISKNSNMITLLSSFNPNPVSFTYLYIRKETPEILKFVDTLTAFIKKEQLSAN